MADWIADLERARRAWHCGECEDRGDLWRAADRMGVARGDWDGLFRALSDRAAAAKQSSAHEAERIYLLLAWLGRVQACGLPEGAASSVLVATRGLSLLAFFYLGEGRLAEAERVYGQVLEIAERVFRESPRDLADYLWPMACIQIHLGALQRAEQIMLRSLAIQPRSSVVFGQSALLLAAILARQGREAESRDRLQQALASWARILGAEEEVAACLASNARQWACWGLHAEAAALQKIAQQGLDPEAGLEISPC
ncbi:MAG: tetratricopeptide repeat protein [Deltaproteobacteria bacterium]|nr:tetratricopeptide repeat protein [Deltaproteobacteria bacterium]